MQRNFRPSVQRPDPDESAELEIEHYLAERADRLVEEGWDPDEARREAERRFGPVERYRPGMTRSERRRRRMRTMGSLWDFFRDGVGSAARTARRYPGFALGVVLTLGLGVGANAAMFGVVDRLLLQPPAGVVDVDEVYLLAIARGRQGPLPAGAASGDSNVRYQHALTYPDVRALEEHGGFAGVARYSYGRNVTVGDGSEAVSVRARWVSHDFFSVLGVSPALGRFFSDEEDALGAAPTVVLSREYWERAYGADPSVLGRALELGGRDYTVVGIAPRAFTGTTLDPVDLWMAMEPAQEQATGGSAGWYDNRGSFWVQAVARLAPGANPEAAEAEATGIFRAAGGNESFRAQREDEGLALRPLMQTNGGSQAEVVKWLLGVSVLVLLIACANVANLLLARGARRRKEVAVRLALGVSRSRLIGQMSFEAVTLALVGGGVALLLARWGGDALRTVLLPDVFFPDALGARVVLFTLAASVLAGLLAGVGPALQSTRADLAASLTEATRGSSSRRTRTRSALAVAQAALSVVLLVGAGLFVRSIDQVRSLDLGFDVDELLLASLELNVEGLEPSEVNALHSRAAEVSAALPGVRSASITQSPFRWAYAQTLEVPGLDSIPRMPGGGPYYYAIDDRYFETVGLSIVEGRDFTDSDREGSDRVAIVSRNMADSLWGVGAAVGQCLLVGRDAETCTTVVGVVEEASRGSLEQEPYFAYYMPIGQTGYAAAGLYIRAGDPDAVAGALARELRSFAPQIRFARVQTLREILDPQARSWALGAAMFTLFGVLALVVAAVGLYSLLAFNVAERRREIGIRTALGAQRGAILRNVVGDGARLVGGGVVLGLLAAWVAAPRVEELLFRVQPRDPWVMGTVAVTLLAVALVASALPGWRASRVDPTTALRSE